MDTSHVARPYQYAGGDYVPYAHYGFADYPNGQLRSNTLDLGNFMIACLSGGTLGQNTILSQSAISEMWSPQFSTLDERQGLNWYQEELYHSNGTAWLWGHNGGESGASTDMYLDPVNNIGICILTNGEGDALYICDELYDYALSLNPTASIVPNCDEVVSFTENEQHEKTIRVFPNPTTHQLTFDLSSMNEKSDIAILSIEGKELFRKNGLTPDLHHIPLQLPFGFYYYAILNSDMTIKKLGKFVIAN